MSTNRKKKKSEKSSVEMDQTLFEYVQTQGGITFKEPNYVLTGDGYTKIIHIYKLPDTLRDFWMSKLCSIDGTLCTIDISTKDSNTVKKNINKALQEEYSRQMAATDFMQIYEAKKRQQQLQNMYDEIESMGEVVKMVHFRIFVSGRNIVTLEEKTEKIMEQLEADQFMPTILLSEGKAEWSSMFRSYARQHQEPFCIKGHSLMTEQLAGGNPFHYSDLGDEFGTFLGFTPCGGSVIFDEFTKTENRKHYNSLYVGDMGSGKSTLLKKRFRSRAERGDFIRCFDVTGEFEALTHEFGGKIIKCDGQQGMLNPLEILRAGDDDFTSFARHISKVGTFFKCYVPGASDEVMMALSNALRGFYDALDLIPNERRSITGLPAKDYPIFSDFLLYLKDKMAELKAVEAGGVERAVLEKELIELDQIARSVQSMVGSYGRIFDGHTSIDNISDMQIVTFDISTIKDLGSVFVAQIFNMVSLCWDNCISNGSLMKEKYESGEIKFEDVVRFLIIIDESHRWVNTKLPMILDLIIIYQREARKYFGGIALASQSVRDYVPEGINSPHIDMIKTVFELTQYKFIFRQDSAALPLIDTIFNNVLTGSQRQQIPTLSVGETLLCISGDRNIKMKIWRSKAYEEKLFKGGA